MEPKKNSYWKFVGAFLALIILALGGLLGWSYYKFKSGEKAVENLADALKKWNDELYQKQLADTYGGKTPQETLEMYIAAVEAGDYELASKYFVIEKREGWRVELDEIKNSGKVDVFIAPLKQANFSSGEYTADGKSFSIYIPSELILFFIPAVFGKF